MFLTKKAKEQVGILKVVNMWIMRMCESPLAPKGWKMHGTIFEGFAPSKVYCENYKTSELQLAS
jgi:hypothetical protein